MRIRPRALLPPILLAIGLVVAGCASNDSTGSAGAESGGGSGGRSIAFATPTAGAQVSSPVKFDLTATGVEIGEPETGNMHFHLYVDDSSQYKIVYSKTGDLDVPAGEHTIKAVLANPNHQETDTTTTQKVTVSGSGGQAPATTSAGGGGYSYP